MRISVLVDGVEQPAESCIECGCLFLSREFDAHRAWHRAVAQLSRVSHLPLGRR